MKRITEITLEVEEKIVLRHGETLLTQSCHKCQALVDMASPPIAALLQGSSEREIFRLIESGSVHFNESDGILICLSSLLILKE